MAEFMVLSLKDYDAVLGIQWLGSLGSITWDFNSMVMEFTNKGSSCSIQGLLLGNVELMSKKELTKCFSMLESEVDPCVVIITTEQQLSITTPIIGKQPANLQALLEGFEELFQIPTGLPSSRLQDHRILLSDEGSVVKIRPNKYLMVQKNELERLTKEMLQTEVIRDSCSLFVSLVVMVMKKDRSWRLCVDYRQFN